jgi:hypothetical protein
MMVWSPRENDEFFGEPQEEDRDPPATRVTGAPSEIWLVYGDLEEDTTHAEEERHGEVHWCGDKQFPSDVRYVLAEEFDKLRDALESIRQYGSDTLSGRVDGTDDRNWQRDGVLEMTKRARLALTPNV